MEINELAKALVAAQGEFSAVPKGSDNPFFKSKYADLPDVVKHAGPVLSKHGLAVSQFIELVETADGSSYDALRTYLIHESGQFITHVMRLHLPKSDPQGQGSAVTYARRYSYMAVLGLVSDVDDDGNAASPRQAVAVTRVVPRPKVEATGDVSLIIQAAELAPDNEFLNSLAEQYNARGSLSEKQLLAGLRQAKTVIQENKELASNAVKQLSKTFGSVEPVYAEGEEPF